MASDLDLTEQEQASLAELAELDMALARHVHAHALAADDPATIADLARAYQRIARSARQSLALTAKLRRDAARDALEAAREARLKAGRDAILAPFAVRYARPAYEPHGDEAYDDEDEADEDFDDDEDQDGAGDEVGDDSAAAAAPAAPPDPALLAREAGLRPPLAPPRRPPAAPPARAPARRRDPGRTGHREPAAPSFAFKRPFDASCRCSCASSPSFARPRCP